MGFMRSSLEDYLDIFYHPFGTTFWLGNEYHSKYGNVWPGQDDPPIGFKNPCPKNALLVVGCMAIFMTFLRSFFERYIGSTLAAIIGIKKPKMQSPMYVCLPALETLLKSQRYKSPSRDELKTVVTQDGVTIRDGEKYVRLRQQQVLSTRHTKFVESCWRFVFYGSMFAYGCQSLWNEDYLWNTEKCWVGYPIEIWAMKDAIYWYYMIELGYYVSCLVYQFYEVKRKDFLQMFIHHIATVFLIGMSYVTSRTRIGALVMLVHDFSDISLEACKMAKYAKLGEAANTLFGVFAVSFFVSRIVIFPYNIMYSSVFESQDIAGDVCPSLNILNFLLMVLYLLHCFWFSLIVRLIVKFSRKEQVEGDLRSEDEAPGSSDEQSEEEDLVKGGKAE